MESFDLLSMLVSILLRLATGFILLGLFTVILTEATSTVFKLRGRFLYKYLSKIFNSKTFTNTLYEHPLIKIQGKDSSYINVTYFSIAFTDSLGMNESLLPLASKSVSQYKENDFVQAFYKLSASATSMAELKKNAATLFNTVVHTISGHYKQTIQTIVFIIATTLVVGFNINSVRLFNSISKNELTSKVIYTLKEDKDSSVNAQILKAEKILSQLPADAYPLGWSAQDIPRNATAFLSMVIGWLITIIFTVFSAQMIFGLLNKYINVRSSATIDRLPDTPEYSE